MTQFNAPAYDIERPTGQCVFTGRVLQPGEAYISALVELTAEQIAQLKEAVGKGKAGNSSSAAAGLGLKRLDISIEAWAQGQRPERLFSHWKSTVPQPNQKRNMFVDDAALLSLFRRLGDPDQGPRAAFRFVLGMILMRKKLLKYQATENRPTPGAPGAPGPDGQVQEWWLLQPRGEDVQLEMLNPHMDDAKIEEVREQLSEVLAGEL